jgi:predicted RecA/RadA family phage recombinase
MNPLFARSPYYDDLTDASKFLRVMFKPGVAVQTRELNQLQSVIGKQIETFGKHIFKNGSVVIPGNTSFDVNASYVKLVGSIDPNLLIGKVLTGQTSGVTALVVYAVTIDGLDPSTIFVKYTASGTDTLSKTFNTNETLIDSGNTVRVVVGSGSDSTGLGSIASIEPGYYFIKNFFVPVDKQTVILDKYSNTPSCRVGLDAIESMVTSDDDQTLFDNATGTNNYSAPGADRYSVNLVLVKKSLTDTVDDQNFIQLIISVSGKLQQKIDNSEYAVLESSLARRTFDEAGDYTVKAFPLDIRENRNNFRGAWNQLTVYLSGDVVTTTTGSYQCRFDGTSNTVSPTQLVGSTTAAATGVVWTFEKLPFFNRGINTQVNTASIGDQLSDQSFLLAGLEPGKAYVSGYEIEKVGTTYVKIPKSRNTAVYNSTALQTTVGNYIVATNMNSLPDIDTLGLVSLYDRFTSTVGTSSGNLIGTARIRYIESNNDTALGLQTTKYKISLFDVKMVSGYNFNSNVKQLFMAGGSIATSFSVDIFPTLSPLTGSISNTATAVNGVGTLFQSDVSVGDYLAVQIGGVVYRQVVTSVNSNTSITIDAAFSVAVTGQFFYRAVSVINETNYNALLFLLPKANVSSIDDTATSYVVAKTFTASTTASAVIVITATTGTFAATAEADNYLVLNATTGVAVAPVSIVSSNLNLTLTITLPSATTATYKIVAAINRSGSGTRKTKTLSTETITVSTPTLLTGSVIKLAHPDGYRVLDIKMDTGTFAAPTGVYGTDISYRYSFDDGQRDAFYDLARIVLSAGESVPTAPVQVTYEYFAQSGVGDYYNINSYTGSIKYEDIPLYGGIKLSELLDYRPSINSSGIAFDQVGTLPKRGNNAVVNYSTYLGRNNLIALNQNGTFFSVDGVASTEPKDPEAAASGMVLYKIRLKPFTASSSDLSVETVNNKRYTMRDIGKLESRVDNIEYYTSLSLLEQSTQSLEIQDEFGLNRYKNGFIVDDFTTGGPSDINSPDYSVSIDPENGEMRPAFSMENVNLVENSVTPDQRSSLGYQVSGDMVTLKYTQTSLIKQGEASRVENVNPFAIFTFIGSAELNPPSDEWFEVNRKPDLVTNVEGNYSATYGALNSVGALNTVWNCWQTQWTGVPVTTVLERFTTDRVYAGVGQWANQRALAQGYTQLDSADFNARFGVVGGAVGPPARQVVTGSVAITSLQTRTGVRTVVVPKFDSVITADRVLYSAVIPYIRSRSLLFVVRGLKPNTKFTAFFDSVDVSTFTSSASQISVTKTLAFSSTVRAGNDASEAGRLNASGNTESALDRGDLVFVQNRGGTVYTKQTSPATAVLALHDSPTVATSTTFHLVNVKGTFQVGDVVQGSITAVATTITAIASPVSGLVSTASGDVVGIFNIPNTSSSRFRTGTRIFALSDNATNNSALATSYVRKPYVAEGILQTKQASVTSTRNADLRQEAQSDSQSVVQTAYRVISDTGWYDPLAQTFLVQSEGGAFLTSVDLFFASKDTSTPVRLQIREVVGGFPGKLILPFSDTVLMPSSVNVATTFVTAQDGGSYPSPIATRFTFESPVYVQNKTEYCIVLMSDSNAYKVWISNLGEMSVITNKVISEQPYAGVLFKSQNASTWTADQAQDLMFTINKAVFDTSVIGDVTFVNSDLPTVNLVKNPFNTVAGTNSIRVYQPNHGLIAVSAASSVIISGAPTFAGIPATEINGPQVITYVEIDSYVIQSTTTATFSGDFGGSAVMATRNVQFNLIQPFVQQQVYPLASIGYMSKLTSGKSTAGAEISYTVDTAWKDIAVNQNNILRSVAMIASAPNQVSQMGSQKSIQLRALLSSANSNLSPVIDTARLSAIVIQNRIDSPTNAINNPSLDIRVVTSSNATVAVTELSKFFTSDAATMLQFGTAVVGKQLSVNGFVSAGNNGIFTIVEVASDGSYIKVLEPLVNVALGASITIQSRERFVSEIAPIGGSSAAKYVTKKITLSNPSTFLKIRFAADIGQASDVQVYYKVQQSNSVATFVKQVYTLASPDSAISRTDNGRFTDVEYNIKNLPSFDAVAVKIVYRGSSFASDSKIKDLIIIGCA